MVAFKNSSRIKANSSFCTFRFSKSEHQTSTKHTPYQHITRNSSTQHIAHFVFMPIKARFLKSTDIEPCRTAWHPINATSVWRAYIRRTHAQNRLSGVNCGIGDTDSANASAHCPGRRTSCCPNTAPASSWTAASGMGTRAAANLSYRKRGLNSGRIRLHGIRNGTS